jgi:hypothetical protein
MSEKEKIILTSAPPPLHSIAVVFIMTIVFVGLFPSMESVDRVATVETFTRRVFPDLITVEQMAYIRLAIAGVIWATSFHTMFLSPGWIQTTNYLKGTRLLRAPNTLYGIKTMYPFTSWAWNMLGVSFTLSGYIALQQEASPLLLRLALFFWEASAPFSFLVATVIRYAIWPGVLKGDGDTTNLKKLRNKLMHNANVMMSLTEAALLGGLPVHWKHVSIGPLVGVAYILFTWAMSTSWNDTSKVGPQFIYFFFDTTLPGYTPTIALLVLLFVLMLFFSFFAACDFLLGLVPFGVVGHALFALGLGSITMRFRD